MSKLELKNVQVDILLDGLPKRAESFFFFQIIDDRVKDFCRSLKQVAREISNVEDTKKMRGDINATTPARKEGELVKMAGANIAFSWNGLKKMSAFLAQDISKDKTGDDDFTDGMKAHAIVTTAGRGIGDPIKPGTNDPDWEQPFMDSASLHGVILVAGNDDTQVTQKLDSIKKVLQLGTASASVKELKRNSGKVRPSPFVGHEHFGFNDGISQPAVEGVDKPHKGQDTIDQGVILCNRGRDAGRQPSWMTDGSFMCFRKLEQNVPAWDKFVVDSAKALGMKPGQMGARLIGRWPSGCPVQHSPNSDSEDIAADSERTNDFEFDRLKDDKCPMAAHIRKTNPRNDLTGNRKDTNRFRILRRAIPYGNEVRDDPNGTRGLLFVCYQSTIKNGFAEIQSSWANNRDFLRKGVGFDAVLGQLSKSEQVDIVGMSPANLKKPVQINAVNPFVIPRGGEYFFTPSMEALNGSLSDVKGGRPSL